jgi:hypothetical protein
LIFILTSFILKYKIQYFYRKEKIVKPNFLLFCILLWAVVYAVPETENKPDNQETLQIKQIHSLSNINNWAYWCQYNGMSGRDPIMDGSGGIYPRGTASIIYEDGLIWGAYVQDNNAQNPRVGGQTYNIGTAPGRILVPGTYPQGASGAVAEDPNNPQVRLYRIDPRFTVPWDQLTPAQQDEAVNLLRQDVAENLAIDDSLVTLEQIEDMVNALATDWAEWPSDRGAPLNEDGTPGIADADQVIWYVVNDLDPALTTNLYGSDPMGIELQVTIWAFNRPSQPAEDAIFKRYRIINQSGCRFDSMFVAQWSDPDVGMPGDDFAGCDTLLQMGYAYNSTNVDSLYLRYGLSPAAAGYVLLYGPVVPSPGDTAIYNLKKLPDYRNLPMTSFSYFAGGSPFTDPPFGDYAGTLYWYKMLNGYAPNNDDMNDLVRYTIGSGPGAGQPTRFPLAGDPYQQTGDLDGRGDNLAAGDRRMALSSGPFTMQPGDTQEVMVLVAGGLGENNLLSVEYMKNTVSQLRYSFGIPVVSLPHQEKVIRSCTLEQNYPNPFNPLTTITFTLPGRENVRLDVFNLTGKKVKVLEHGQMAAGTHQVQWDGRNDSGKMLGSGVYFYRLKAGDFVQTRRMLLLK